MKSTLSIFLFSILFAVSSVAQTSKGEPLLEKKTFTIKIKQIATVTGKKAKEAKEEDDEFSFRGGKFKSKMFTEQFRVPTKPYEIADIDSSTGSMAIVWKCEAAIDDVDKVTFEGRIEGNSISGTAEWTVKNKPKKTIDYEFTGEIKEKKKKATLAAPEK